MGPTERRALLTLLGLGLAGHALRAALRPGEPPPGALTVLEGLVEGSAEAQGDSARAAGRPLELGERVDVDVAPARELLRLPGVGPGLAAAIVEERGRGGPFGSLEGLGRTRGIGRRTLERLAPHVTFSAAGAPVAGRLDPAGPVPLNSADSATLLGLPGVGPALAHRLMERRRRGRIGGEADLLAVPGIGPKTVERLRGLVRFD